MVQQKKHRTAVQLYNFLVNFSFLLFKMAGTVVPISNNNSYNLLTTYQVPSTCVKCFIHIALCKPHKSLSRNYYYPHLTDEEFQAQISYLPKVIQRDSANGIFSPPSAQRKVHSLLCYTAYVLKKLHSSLRVWKSDCPLRGKFKNQVIYLD